MLFNVKKQTKDVCNKKSLESKEMNPKKKAKQEEFIQLANCIHSGNAQIKQCANLFKAKVLGIQNAEKDKKLPLLCCELIQIKKCMFQTLTVQPGCNTPEAAQKMKDSVSNFGASAISSACGEYNSEDKCKGLVYPKKKKSQRVPKSFIMPILTVINSI